MGSITYTCDPDNVRDVLAFIGEQPKCPDCDGWGEYETEHGPQGCQPCNSRCIAFVDAQGVRVYADWGDTIIRTDAGLTLLYGSERQ